MKLSIDPSIFHDYDIRGVYPTQINEESYYIIGRAIAQFLRVNHIAVGHDTRLSSPILFKSLTNGILDAGCDVVDLGLISTEMSYFASGFYGFDANVVISASHNPPEFNGIKIVKKNVVPLHAGNGLADIKRLAIKNDFSPTIKKGTKSKKLILDDWVSHALSFIRLSAIRNLKVVVDAGNGTGGIAWSKVKENIPASIIPLYWEPDGNFPHHLPDPLNPDNLEDVSKKIIEEGADVGFALDGDADRLFVLDENGKPVSGTITTAMLASYLLKKYGPGPVLYNVVCGKIVPETVKSMGGTPIRVRVGHSFIKEYMKQYNALFAGEHSGHLYFRQNYNADSSLIGGLLILEYLSNANRPLSQIVAEFDKYPTSGEINFKIDEAQRKLSEIESHLKDASSIDHIDGTSIWYPDWWCNIRVSKTEGYVRLNIEADNKEILENSILRIENIISKLGGKRV